MSSGNDLFAIDRLEASMREVNFVSADGVVKSAASLVRTALEGVEGDASLRQAADNAVAAVHAACASITLTASALEIEMAKRSALEKIDALRKALAAAPKSARARHIGL